MNEVISLKNFEGFCFKGQALKEITQKLFQIYLTPSQKK